MADIQPGSIIDSVPEIPEDAQMVMGHALDRAKDELEREGMIVPFTATLTGDQVLVELAPGDNPQECYTLARHAVEGMRGARAYAFCYDGFVDTNQGMKDAIIAEGGVPGAPDGYAIAYMYEAERKDADGNPIAFKVNATPTYIGEADNMMKGLTELSESADIVDGSDTSEGVDVTTE